MKVHVLGIRIVGKGIRIAHVKAGELFGDVPARDGVQAGQAGSLKNTVMVRDGRLIASLYVEPLGE